MNDYWFGIAHLWRNTSTVTVKRTCQNRCSRTSSVHSLHSVHSSHLSKPSSITTQLHCRLSKWRFGCVVLLFYFPGVESSCWVWALCSICYWNWPPSVSVTPPLAVLITVYSPPPSFTVIAVSRPSRCPFCTHFGTNWVEHCCLIQSITETNNADACLHTLCCTFLFILLENHKRVQTWTFIVKLYPG